LAESDLPDFTADENAKVYRLSDFEGPLDLLLFLIKKNEVNIYDIPIASITDQFLFYLDNDQCIGLDDLTEFYNMAASLLLIKSRMLLPIEVSIDDEFDDPRQELIEKLIEYQKYKKLSDLMEQKEMEVEWSIERTRMQRQLPFDTDERLWDRVDIWDLLQTFSSMVKGISSERILDIYEEVSVNEKLALIHELLEEKGAFSFVDLLIRRHSTIDFVCAFLAILEAVKLKEISIYQHRLFGDIQIRSYRDQGAPE
jgi:segregation and condensation protein A